MNFSEHRRRLINLKNGRRHEIDYGGAFNLVFGFFRYRRALAAGRVVVFHQAPVYKASSALPASRLNPWGRVN